MLSHLPACWYKTQNEGETSELFIFHSYVPHVKLTFKLGHGLSGGEACGEAMKIWSTALFNVEKRGALANITLFFFSSLFPSIFPPFFGLVGYCASLLPLWKCSTSMRFPSVRSDLPRSWVLHAATAKLQIDVNCFVVIFNVDLKRRLLRLEKDEHSVFV